MAPAEVTEDEASRKTDVHIFLDQSLQCFCSRPQVRQLGQSTRTAAKVKSQGEHRAPAPQQQAQTHSSPAALTCTGNSSPP